MAYSPRVDDTLSPDMVDIYVGPLREHFSVQEELLCQDAPVFDRMFKSGFMEGLSKSADLPEEEPETFDTFLDWLYDDTIEEIEVDKSRPWEEPMLGRIELFLFAEKYCIDDLADYAMDTILGASKDWELRDFPQPSLPIIHLVYENTLPGSGLRLYLARCSALAFSFAKPEPSEREIRAYIESGGYSDSVRDLLRELWADMFRHWPNHPYAAPICDYHRHGVEKECLTRLRDEASLDTD